PRGFFIEVERLRVVLLRKADNVFLVNTHAAVRLEHLSDCEILEIPFRHRSIPPASDGGEYNGRPWGHTWGNFKGSPFLSRRAAAIIRGIWVDHDLRKTGTHFSGSCSNEARDDQRLDRVCPDSVCAHHERHAVTGL